MLPAYTACPASLLLHLSWQQQTTHGAIQFAAYEELKHLAARAGSGGAAGPDRQLTSAEVSAYGAASKFLAAVSTYPTQVGGRLQVSHAMTPFQGPRQCGITADQMSGECC
jgi:hypothetical protein